MNLSHSDIIFTHIQWNSSWIGTKEVNYKILSVSLAYSFVEISQWSVVIADFKILPGYLCEIQQQHPHTIPCPITHQQPHRAPKTLSSKGEFSIWNRLSSWLASGFLNHSTLVLLKDLIKWRKLRVCETQRQRIWETSIDHPWSPPAGFSEEPA